MSWGWGNHSSSSNTEGTWDNSNTHSYNNNNTSFSWGSSNDNNNNNNNNNNNGWSFGNNGNSNNNQNNNNNNNSLPWGNNNNSNNNNNNGFSWGSSDNNNNNNNNNNSWSWGSNNKTIQFCSNDELEQKINAIDGRINELIRKHQEQISGTASLSNLCELTSKIRSTFRVKLSDFRKQKLRIYDQILSNNKVQLQSKEGRLESEQTEINVIESEDKEIDEKIKRYQEMIEELKCKKENNKILKATKKEILNEREFALNKIKKTCNKINEMMKKIRGNLNYETNSNMMESINESVMNKLKQYEAKYHEWSTQDVIKWVKCTENGKYIFDAHVIKQIETIKICGNKLSDLKNESVLQLIGLRGSDQICLIQHVDRVINDNKLNDERQDMCTLCVSNRINSVFIPCGHQFCCFQCYAKSKPKYQNCPICRKQITNTVKTFMNGF